MHGEKSLLISFSLHTVCWEASYNLQGLQYFGRTEAMPSGSVALYWGREGSGNETLGEQAQNFWWPPWTWQQNLGQTTLFLKVGTITFGLPQALLIKPKLKRRIYSNLTKKRDSRASALRMNGLPYPIGLVLTQPVRPTPCTWPRGPIPKTLTCNPIIN